MKFIARLLKKSTGQVYGGEYEANSFETAEKDAVAKFGALNEIITIYPEDYLVRLDWHRFITAKRLEEARRKQEAEDDG